MKIRHLCAVLGVAAAVGAVVFLRSLVTTSDAQAARVAERLLAAVPVDGDAQTVMMQVDFRPDGHVLQGPPMMAFVATAKGASAPATGTCRVTKGFFAQRRVRNLPKVGDTLTFVGRKGAYQLQIAGYLDWERSARGYPNVFVSPETAATIDEQWQPWEQPTAERLSAAFTSDAGRHMDRAKPLLLWAAALTALCLLLNSLFLTVESRRKELAVLRMVGLTRAGVARCVVREALVLSLAGFVVGTVGALLALFLYVAADGETFPMGMAVDGLGIGACVLACPFVAALAALLALRPALAVRPLEAASDRLPHKRRLGMLIAVACGYGAFVAVEVWGTSLTKPFIPSPEWPDAIVSILPGGVSAFDIERLQKIEGVRKIAELQPLQVNFDPPEEMKGFGGGAEPKGAKGAKPQGAKGAKPPPREGGMDGRPPMRSSYRNALLLASDWLPDFRFVAGERATAEKAVRDEDACVITEMMARARKLKVGDMLRLDGGRGLKIALKIVGIVDLNWHMVTSRGLVRGLNRMPGNTDGPVFVSFDTLAGCDTRPQDFVKMTHLWLDYEPAFLAEHGVFPAGRLVEQRIVEALDGAFDEDGEGQVHGNTVRLHARDEVADGTLSHGAALVGAMARVPFIFLAVLSLGFIAMLVSSFDARRREFAVLRAVGATPLQLAKTLVGEALATSLWALVFGLVVGALVGWLCTAGTRAAMANWGLPPSFALPVALCLKGAAGTIVFTLLVAVPTALSLVRRSTVR